MWLEPRPVERQRRDVEELQPAVVQVSDALSLLTDQLLVGERDCLETRAAECEGVPALADPDGLLGGSQSGRIEERDGCVDKPV